MVSMPLVAPEAVGVGKGNDRAQPLTQVNYIDLWPGISLRYTATVKGIMQSTWEIAAEGDANQIRLRYNAPVKIAADGSLQIHYDAGWMRESPPIAWQTIGSQRRPVAVSFCLIDTSATESVIGFKVGHYDSDYPLLIDPTLAWNTFMGSGEFDGDDIGVGIAVDPSGNAYVVGESLKSWGTPVNPHADSGVSTDVFVAKLDKSGVRLWNTFMGSKSYRTFVGSLVRAQDTPRGIAVDASGNVYVVGESMVPWGAPVNAHTGRGQRDVFVAKLNNSGVRLWNTFMGSKDFDVFRDTAGGISVGANGNVYVTGHSDGTWGTPVNAFTYGDAFVTKLNSNGVRLWNTFIGGSSADIGRGIAVDTKGNIYVAGESATTWGAPVNAHSGGDYDVFVAMLNNSGVLSWNTFMGCVVDVRIDGKPPRDFATGITVDTSGDVYVAGGSMYTWGTPLNAHVGSPADLFVAKLNNSGVRLWNTFMGTDVNPIDDFPIAVDVSGNVFVAGGSRDWGTPVNAHAGRWDAFVAKLNSSGVRLWNTFMGAPEFDTAIGITLDSYGDVYVTGRSEETWGTPVNPFAGQYEEYDAFVAKLNVSACKFFVIKHKSGRAVVVCL
jgi:hypothetical protein